VIKGALSFLSGLRLLLAQAELRPVLWRMLALLAVLLVVLSIGVFWMSASLAAMFIPAGDAWYVDALAWLVWLFSFVLALIAGVLGYTALGTIAAAPWLDQLCIIVERLDGKSTVLPRQSWWQTVITSIWNILMPLLGFLPWALLALLLLLIPVVGAMPASLILTYAGIRLLSFEFMDAPASRRGWKWKERKEELNRNRWFYFGFSGLASLLIVIPVLNLFVLPAAVIGLSRAFSHRSTAADQRFKPEIDNKAGENAEDA